MPLHGYLSRARHCSGQIYLTRRVLTFSCFPSHLQSVCFHRAFARFSLFFASAPHSVGPYCPVLRLPGRHSFHIRVVAPVTPGFSILNPLLALLQHCWLLSGPSSSFKFLVTCNLRARYNCVLSIVIQIVCHAVCIYKTFLKVQLT